MTETKTRAEIYEDMKAMAIRTYGGAPVEAVRKLLHDRPDLAGRLEKAPSGPSPAGLARREREETPEERIAKAAIRMIDERAEQIADREGITRNLALEQARAELRPKVERMLYG